MGEYNVLIQIGQLLKKGVGFLDPEKQLYLDYDQLTLNDLIGFVKKQKTGHRVLFAVGEEVLEGFRKSVSPQDMETFFMIQSLLAGRCLVAAVVDEEGKILASSIVILRALQFDDKLKRLLEEQKGMVVLKT